MAATCTRWASAVWDADWQPANATMHAIPTNIAINGVPNALPPLDPFARGFRQPQLSKFTLSAELFERAAQWHNRTLASWATAAAMVAPSIVILGMSVTSGCSTGRYFTADGQLVPLPGRHGECVVGYGWARLVVDHLRWQLRGAQDVVVDASVWYKNAVPPDFFAKCTERFTATGPGIILLEVCTTAWGGEEPLVRLLRAIRGVSPHKAVSFVCWQPRTAGGHAQVEVVRKVAQREGADVLDVSFILRAQKMDVRSLYGDAIHPNVFGHDILAASAARFVAQGLMRGGTRACDGSTAARHHVDAPGASTERRLEFCFSSADEIPVLPPATTSSWAVVDEGGGKGVRKLGWVSTRIGDELTIGPVPNDESEQTDVKCATTRIDLGYLMSARRDHQGAFDIACEGCDCASIASGGAKYQFPRVETDPRRSNAQEAAAVVGMNATVTVATSFDVLLHDRRKDACYLKVRHRVSARIKRPTAASQGASATSTWEPHPADASHSRIRIDSLVMTRGEFNPAYVGYSWVRGNNRRGGPKWLMRQAAPCLRASADVRRACEATTSNNRSSALRSWMFNFFNIACRDLEIGSP